jgi:hypothetical protein
VRKLFEEAENTLQALSSDGSGKISDDSHSLAKYALIYKRGCKENTSPSTGRRGDFRDIQPLSP